MKRRKKARRVQSAIAKFALVAAVAPIVMTSVHRFNGSTVQLAWRIPGCDLSSEFDGGISPAPHASSQPPVDSQSHPGQHPLSVAASPSLHAKWVIHIPQLGKDATEPPDAKQTPAARRDSHAAPAVSPKTSTAPQHGHTYAIELSQTIGFSAKEVNAPR